MSLVVAEVCESLLCVWLVQIFTPGSSVAYKETLSRSIKFKYYYGLGTVGLLCDEMMRDICVRRGCYVKIIGTYIEVGLYSLSLSVSLLLSLSLSLVKAVRSKIVRAMSWNYYPGQNYYPSP